MTEHRLQSELFQTAWNELPQTRKLLCYNLNNSKNRIDGNRNKAMGLIAGRSDMTFYWQGRAYFLELKLPGQKQTPGQKKWEEVVKANGFEYHIIESVEQGLEILRGIIGCD